MKKMSKVVPTSQIEQGTVADKASVRRVAESGLDLKPIGLIATAMRIEASRPVLVYNSTGAVIFVAFGAQDMAAPTGAADGIPVKANDTLMLNSGDGEYVRASAAGVYAYTGDNS